jgi:hypothetical protein
MLHCNLLQLKEMVRYEGTGMEKAEIPNAHFGNTV